MDILKVVGDKIYVQDKNGYIDCVKQEDHGIRSFRDVWGVQRFPLLTGFGKIQFE